MADNYLENKMEEHRNGSARRPAPRLTPAGRKPGYALLPFDVKTATVRAAESSALLGAIASEIRGTGCRVAICIPDTDAKILAQKLSCAYVASDSDDAALKLWEETELDIRIDGDTVELYVGRGQSRIIRSENTTPEAFVRRAAQLCVYLALPDSAGRVYGTFVI